MLLRRYGTTVQSVEMNFDARAMNEVGFRRDQRFSLPWEEFETGYHRVEGHELEATAEGWVQDEAEHALLQDLAAKILGLLEGLGEGDVLLVESEQGNDYPKTRDEKKNVVVEGVNRLYFEWRVEPPLRVGVYRKGS
jgi:hypothetical protein